MKIIDGYYIAECTSNAYPEPRKDENTFYLPFDVEYKKGIYVYKEYRFNLPINYKIPAEEIIERMACMCENCSKCNKL